MSKFAQCLSCCVDEYAQGLGLMRIKKRRV